ncbi:sigma-70 family RNA polymerase sigma factor [Sphingomonas sp.]|uniref:RNA polymerase sigma factor n=1 Tax=Sphingomonas sp. TaxID=28214 RepID=UPI002DF054BE|nr:sigma-70 family RNA polymerase sigma factor [Sphingomonas sp.]
MKGHARDRRERSASAGPARMNTGGLEAIYLAHRPELLRFLRARGAGDAAEDLLQELWLKASTGLSGPIQDPLSYLYRAANNLMIDRARAEASAAKRGRDWTDVTTGLSEASDAPSAERALLAREQLIEAQRTLAALGDRTEEIFRRFRVDGVPQKRIAAEQGISINTVEKHLQRAYRALVALRRRTEAAESGAEIEGLQP